MPIKHLKVSLKTDAADSSLVRASDWNATHDLTGLVASDITDFSSAVSAAVGYPVTLAKGGTAATTAAGALTNLTIPNLDAIKVTKQAPANWYAEMFPAAPGMASFSFYSDAQAAANNKGLAVSMDSAAGAVISTFGTGTFNGFGNLPLGLQASSVRFPDGTVAVPGLAWASEPGMGWYRAAAGDRGFAVGGKAVEFLDTSATGTALSLYPSAGGGNTSFGMLNQPLGSANANLLGIAVTPANYSITGDAVGSATPIPLDLVFSAGVQLSTPTPILRLLGTAANGDSHIVMARAAGSGGNQITGVIGNVARWIQTMGDGNSNWAINRYSAAGGFQEASITVPANTGDVHVARNFVVGVSNGSAGFSGSAGIVVNTAEQSLYMYGAGGGAQYRLFMTISSGLTSLQTNGVVRTSWGVDGWMQHFGGAIKPNGGPWDAPSDIRAKQNLAPYTRGLEDILAYEPVTYQYTNDDPKIYVGRVSQAVKAVDPAMVYTKDIMGIEDFEVIDMGPDIYKVFNAIKTLNARIVQLEARLEAAGL